MINRSMRVMVFFDLPVATKSNRREYAKFRKLLIKDGFDMLQFSIYSRVAMNHDDAQKHINYVHKIVPSRGSVRILQVTERQYNSMEIVIGTKTKCEDYLSPKEFIEL